MVSNTEHKEQEVWGIILAAGQGKRMKTHRPKVAHTVLGRPMVLWAIESMRKAGVQKIAVVLSPHQKTVHEIVEGHRAIEQIDLCVAWQEKALGTGHAALCGLNSLIEDRAQRAAKAPSGNASSDSHFSAKNLENVNVLVGFGDTPAISPDSYHSFLTQHRSEHNEVTVFGFTPENPTGYGRILRGKEGKFEAIREEKDCTSGEKLEKLCNSGLLCARANVLVDTLPKLSTNNASQEYYLTDVPGLVHKVGVCVSMQVSEFQGVNSQEQLAQIAFYMQQEIIRSHLENGVQFLDPRSVYIEPGVKIGSGAIIEPNVFLSGSATVQPEERVLFGTSLRG